MVVCRRGLCYKINEECFVIYSFLALNVGLAVGVDE